MFRYKCRTAYGDCGEEISAPSGIPSAGRGSIRQSANPYSIDSVLRIVHTLILAREGGFLLHSAGAIRNGRAFLFSGVSGAGKTTISRLAPPDVTLLTDEVSYIRRDDDGYRACGTPFAGELARVGENCSAPIGCLFFLKQGPENKIEPMAKAEAIRRLMRNILFFAEDSDLVQQGLPVCLRVCGAGSGAAADLRSRFAGLGHDRMSER